MKIGVLALQGDFQAHMNMFARMGVSSISVKKPDDLAQISGLVFPGGESTTHLKLLEESEFKADIARLAERKFPFFGTCAGIILLAKKIVNSAQFSFGVLDIEVERNAYGTQRESFTESVPIPAFGSPDLECVFIRAPKIKNISKQVEVIASHAENPILIKQGNILGSTFHPELTEDHRVHRLFLEMCKDSLDL